MPFQPCLLALALLQPIFLASGIGAILAGDKVDWNRNGFLVKILARDNPEANVKSCTGTLISASLVLTSGHCVVDRTTKLNLREFVVFVLKPSQLGYRSTAKLLEVKEDGSWALLRIPPQNITELCPASPAPKWISRLNFRPSLTDDPRLTVDQAEMTDYRLIGFSTTKNPEEFLTNSHILRLSIERLEQPPKEDNLHNWRSRAFDNFTACYDDGGAPLLCSLESLEEPIQIGLFQSLTVPGGGGLSNADEQEADSLEKCRKATEMRFSFFQDTELARAIERHGLAEFVTVYQKCGFLEKKGEE